MAPELCELVYSSIAARPLSEDDVELLLNQARAENEKQGITGLLIFDGERFLQVLEGERDTVDALFDAIKRDRRHDDVKVFYSGDIDRRSFGSWFMAYRRLPSRYGSGDWINLTAAADALRSAGAKGSMGGRVLKLLHELP